MREQELTPPTIHTVAKSVKLNWHLGIFNFILRLRLCKSVQSAVIVESSYYKCEMVYLCCKKKKRGKK